MRRARVGGDKKVQKVRNERKTKLKTLPQLKKILWKYFSIFIRNRDGHRCFTCGGKGNQAGHYIAQGRSSYLKFDERNVHCQCARCNLYERGNLPAYAVALQRKYGFAILVEFERLRRKEWKPTRYELEEMIRHYKEKVSSVLEEL